MRFWLRQRKPRFSGRSALSLPSINPTVRWSFNGDCFSTVAIIFGWSFYGAFFSSTDDATAVYIADLQSSWASRVGDDCHVSFLVLGSGKLLCFFFYSYFTDNKLNYVASLTDSDVIGVSKCLLTDSLALLNIHVPVFPCVGQSSDELS